VFVYESITWSTYKRAEATVSTDDFVGHLIAAVAESLTAIFEDNAKV
jgi:hypothetical protein